MGLLVKYFVEFFVAQFAKPVLANDHCHIGKMLL